MRRLTVPLMAILVSCVAVDTEDASSATGSPAESSVEKATLGGGCFWCLEAVFERLEGVESVVSGYAGGHVANPSYDQVMTGRTGHAEVIQVRFYPEVIRYEQLLELFFAMHDPTTKNRQGADVGPQYRSIILAHDAQQRETARAMMKRLERNDVFPDPIVTQLEELDTFYEAEAYHQDYYEKNPGQGYCRVVIAPKVNELREKYQGMLKPEYR